MPASLIASERESAAKKADGLSGGLTRWHFDELKIRRFSSAASRVESSSFHTFENRQNVMNSTSARFCSGGNKDYSVLVVDPQSHAGHINYNQGIIEAISSYASVDVLMSTSMVECLRIRCGDKFNVKNSFPDEYRLSDLAKKYRGKLSYHARHVARMFKVLCMVSRIQSMYDHVIFLSVETISFMVASHRFGQNVSVVDHAIGRVDNEALYRLTWKLSSDSPTLIVLEPFIRDMVEKRLPQKKVAVIRHPLPPMATSERGRDLFDATQHAKNFVFAPGAENSTSFLEEICHFAFPKNYSATFILKGKEGISWNDHVKVYSERLDETKYLALLRESSYVLIPYESTYNYRVSGVLFEAVQYGKGALVWGNNTLQRYAAVFPGCVRVFNTVEELVTIVGDDKTTTNCEYEKEPYRKEAIAGALENLMFGAGQ